MSRVTSQWFSHKAMPIRVTGNANDSRHVHALARLLMARSSVLKAAAGRPSGRRFVVATKGECSRTIPPVIELTSSSWLGLVAMQIRYCVTPELASVRLFMRKGCRNPAGASRRLKTVIGHENLRFEKWWWWFNSAGANPPTKSKCACIAVDLSEPE